MRDNLKHFLEKNKELLRQNEFKQLYFEAYEDIPFQIGNMTAAFLQAGINPMLYMDKVMPEMFSNSMLTEVIIPNNVRAINRQAFIDCFELKKITIPKSVVGIESSAFKGCYELEEIVYEGTIEEWSKVHCEPSTFWDCKVEVVTCSDGNFTLPTME